MPGKRVQFDQETWNALNLLARNSMQDFQELADEAAGRSTSRRPCGRAWATSRNARIGPTPRRIEEGSQG
jgi:hypothetical protein